MTTSQMESNPAETRSRTHPGLIRALDLRRAREQAQATLEERIAQAIIDFSGSVKFVYLHIAIFGFWVIANLGLVPGLSPWDPSFVVLAMVASVEAIFLSTFVLISQNRMQAAAEQRAELDLQISLLAEHEITKLVRLVDAVGSQLRRAGHGRLGRGHLSLDLRAHQPEPHAGGGRAARRARPADQLARRARDHQARAAGGRRGIPASSCWPWSPRSRPSFSRPSCSSARTACRRRPSSAPSSTCRSACSPSTRSPSSCGWWTPWDPSFVVLAMVASVEAIFLSTFVLISQNRMQAAAEQRAELDLQISLLAEHEITKLVRLVDAVGSQLRRAGHGRLGRGNLSLDLRAHQPEPHAGG